MQYEYRDWFSVNLFLVSAPVAAGVNSLLKEGFGTLADPPAAAHAACIAPPSVLNRCDAPVAQPDSSGFLIRVLGPHASLTFSYLG